MDQNEQMAFFYHIFHATLPRLGPGDSHSTQKALNTLLAVKSPAKISEGAGELNILDIGCGNGAQTLQLALHLEGTILAVDNHQPFLDELQRRADAAGLSNKIQVHLQDMGTLRPNKNPFDLIWSEGALYNMGFGEGLSACHSLLVPGGQMAVTELSWLRSDPPADCRDYLVREYPPVTNIDSNLSTIEKSGFTVLGYFILSESAWWESFYNPLKQRLEKLRKEYIAESERVEIIDAVKLEIEQYRKYARFYGYVFYLMQRREI